MTLGLAVGNTGGIYLAIESQGLPTSGPPLAYLVITSKILELQSAPEIVALAAGGLEHWSYVATKYSKRSSVAGAADEVARLLDACMKTKNAAFGLVCGFEGRAPKCFRVNRAEGFQAASTNEENLSQVQPLGPEVHSTPAKENATESIGNGTNELLALVEAIQGRLPGEQIRPPIHVRIMRPGC